MHQQEKAETSIIAWIFRLVKGIVIGTGFIIPGVSGGVFAAIFGVYEPMIRFFANITKDFWKNVKFFIPIGIGVLISMILCSKVLGDIFEKSEVPLVWFFIGCVIGTLPTLFQQAGKQGRTQKHFWILGITAVVAVAFLTLIQGWLSGVVIPTNNLVTWLLAGALMGLGAIVPGLSPSNFLLYLNLYKDMMNRIGSLDWLVILPVVAGALLCFLLLSKAFDKLFDKAYAGIYHVILGVVLASTLMIVPLPGKELENGLSVVYNGQLILISVLACAAGAGMGYGMGILEKKYK